MNRAIGPIGTVIRFVIGTFIVVLAIVDSPDRGAGWWDIGAAVIVLPLIAVGAGALVRTEFTRIRSRIILTLLAIAIVVILGTILTFVTPANRVAIFLFFGISMVVAAARGYDGCEILALPKLILGRRIDLWCPLYTPIDTAEERRRALTGEAEDRSAAAP
jgi:hypothetical protein